MEIINLKSSTPEENSESKILKITDIKQAVKNQDRVNIFVNNKYSFSLNIAQVVDFKVKIGRELTEAELEEMKKASAFGKEYQRALEWVLMRPRSVRELRDHLARRAIKQSSWGHPQSLRGRSDEPREDGREERPQEGCLSLSAEEREVIIERLTQKGYLNDEKFAEYYVENRFVKKGISKKRLKMELMKKGIDSKIIENVLESGARNDEEEIKKIIIKKRNKYDDEKLVAYLIRQGFPYDLVKELVSESSDSTVA